MRASTKERLQTAAIAMVPIAAGYAYSAHRRAEWLKQSGGGVPTSTVPSNTPLYVGMALGIGYLFYKDRR